MTKVFQIKKTDEEKKKKSCRGNGGFAVLLSRCHATLVNVEEEK